MKIFILIVLCLYTILVFLNILFNIDEFNIDEDYSFIFGEFISITVSIEIIFQSINL